MQGDDVEAAVKAALCLDWNRAKELNEHILKACPGDVDCLNRLGRSYLELGNTKKAIAIFKEVLKISEYDPIATKNLARATSSINHKRPAVRRIVSLIPVSFLEEPGKTKLVSLVNIAPPKVLLGENYTDPVILAARRHTIQVTDLKDNYLGALPDDIGHRLLILMKGGNKYEGFIKSVSKSGITVFIRESCRSKRFHNTPSFPSYGSDYLSYLREESVSEELNGTAVAGANSEEDDQTEGKLPHPDEEPGEAS